MNFIAQNLDWILMFYVFSVLLMRYIMASEVTAPPVTYNVACRRHNDFVTAIYVLAPCILAIMLTKRTIVFFIFSIHRLIREGFARIQNSSYMESMAALQPTAYQDDMTALHV